MYYLTFRGVKRPISAGLFWPLFIGAFCAIIGAAVVVVQALGWFALIALLAVTASVTINGKEYALIKNEMIRKAVGYITVLSAIVVYILK